MSTVGERLKKARQKAGLSQVELARQIGVSKQSLYKYENNIITNIPSDKIQLAATACNVSPGAIMGWEGSSDQSVIKMTGKLSLTKKEKTHLDKYRQLGAEDQDKVDTITDTLLNAQSAYSEMLLAAHKRTDIEVTPEAVAHDLDLMKNGF